MNDEWEKDYKVFFDEYSKEIYKEYENKKDNIYDNYNSYEIKKDTINNLTKIINKYNDWNKDDPAQEFMSKWGEILGWDSEEEETKKMNYSKTCAQCGVKLHGNTKGDLCTNCKEKMNTEIKEKLKKKKEVMNVVEEMTAKFDDPTKPSKKTKETKKKEKTMSATTKKKAAADNVEGKSVLYNKHGMIYIDLHKEPEQNHLFAFNKTCMPKGLSIVCKGCNEEIEHYSQQFKSYYCPHCLVIYPNKSFDLDTQGGKKELEEWVELVRPIIPGAKKVKTKKKEKNEDFEEALATIKEAGQSGSFGDLGDLFE